jgi:regulator of protease activity HflC (stomatin/prohibitin superfamily)
MKTRNLKNVGLVLMLLLFTPSCTVVKPGYQAMKWKPWGKGLDAEQIYSDGPVWHWPWVSMINYDIKWQTFTEEISILSKDELHINITVSVTLKPIVSEIPKLELEIGKEYYKTIVKPEFISLTRNVFSNYLYSTISPEGIKIEGEILELLKEKLLGMHIFINSITINHIIYPEIVNNAVSNKLAIEQDIEQKDYEIKIAVKVAEIQRITARGQRDAQTIIDSSITQNYLQFKALEVQDKLSTSPNAKFFFVPLGKDGLPIIVDTGGSN